MDKTNQVWLKTEQEKLAALIADEAKNLSTLAEVERTVRQLTQKSKFRLALLHQLQDGKS